MATRTISFESLSPAVRKRLVDAFNRRGPGRSLLSQARGARESALGACATGIFGAWWLYFLMTPGYGALANDDAMHGPGMLLEYVLASSAVCAAVSGLLAAAFIARMTYKPGRYLLPLHIVDATSSRLVVTGLEDVASVECLEKPARVRLKRLDGRTEEFTVEEAPMAQPVTQLMNETLARLRAGQAAELAALDPFLEPGPDAPVDRAGRELRSVPRVLRSKVVAVVLPALLLAGGLWYGRRVLSDDAMLRTAQAAGTVSALSTYLGHGVRHIATVVHELIPATALAEARKGGLEGLSKFQKEYPDPKHVAAAERAWTEMVAEAHRVLKTSPDGDDAMIRIAMTQLVTRVSETSDPFVTVRFRNPTAAPFAEMEPLAPEPGAVNLNPAVVATRCNFGQERAMTTLREGASRSPVGRVVQFRRGDELTGPPGPSGEMNPKAQIEIECRPSATGAFRSDKGAVYRSLDFVFPVRLRIPPKDLTLQFDLAVARPESLTIDNDEEKDPIFGASIDFSALIKGAESRTVPKDQRAYTSMVDRAYDELGTKLASHLCPVASRVP